MINYADAPPEIEKLARKLIREQGLANAETAKVKYIFKHSRKPDSELGYISKAAGHWRFLTEYDFVIVLWADWWAEAPQEDREANLLHQLCHIGINPNSGAWQVEKHPIECFPEEIVTYGAWSLPLKDLMDVVEAELQVKSAKSKKRGAG